MASLSRGAMSVAVAGVLLMGGVFAACGLDENGIVGGDASVMPDVSTDTLILPDIQVDNYVPPPDADIDASCFDAAVPDGWIAVGIKQTGAVTCPGQSTDFLVKQYVTNPTPDSNACECTGCAPTGSWGCSAELRTGPSCNQGLGTANGPGCTTGLGYHYSATTQRTGDAGCSGVQATGDGGASGSPIGACIPQTTQADFCGLAGQGFNLCILNTSVTDGGCPSGFSNATVAGVQAVTACGQCTCTLTNPNAACTGTVSVFGSNDCDDAGGANTFVSSQGADGGCVNTTGFNSALFAPDTPSPSCNAPPPAGQGALVGQLTICCP